MCVVVVAVCSVASWVVGVVLFGEADDAGFVDALSELGFFDAGEAHDDDAVADGALARRGAVEGDAPRAEGGGDDVGLESLAVGAVGDEHFFVFVKADQLHQLAVDADAAFVVEVRIGDAGAGQLRVEHFDLDAIPSYGDCSPEPF